MREDFYTQKPRRAESLWKRGNDGKITLRTVYFQLISLGSMGSDVFEKCDGKTTVFEMISHLKKKYSHTPGCQIETDTIVFLDWLQSLGLLIVHEDDF